MIPTQGGHAVVIGASMGGLLAARALAQRFERVTLLERDEFPAPGEHRKGVPHGRHAHGLLGQGRIVLEQLFPGLTAELERQGAARGDLGGETLWFHSAGFHCVHDSGIVGLVVSRPLLEANVRRRLLADFRVRAITGVDVTGLVASVAKDRITAVRFRPLAGDGSGVAEQVLAADLVVDASGRGSRLPAWLAQLGYAPPRQEQVDIGMRYTTRLFRRRPEQAGGFKAIVKAGTSASPRAGALLAMEGDRWILSMGGYAGDHAPLDAAGMLAYARELGAPQFAEVLEHAEPISDPITFRYPASVRRRYEHLRRFPRGLLAFGDAICTFNPVYGQGMTVAAMQALALRAALGCGTLGLARRFFRRAARLIDIPWTMVIGNDARILDIARYNGRVNRLLGAYLDRLHVAARTDAAVAVAFLRVANLMASPASLLAPAMLWRVWRASRAARSLREVSNAVALANDPA
jgi:2-polyprenyl-6-methoxyphenol hydroxylase-like FAD-dependent oxidoreductase